MIYGGEEINEGVREGKTYLHYVDLSICNCLHLHCVPETTLSDHLNFLVFLHA